jgi:hypothetical protein
LLELSNDAVNGWHWQVALLRDFGDGQRSSAGNNGAKHSEGAV